MKEKEFNEFLLKNNIAISDNRKDSSSFDTDKALNSIRFFSFPYKSLFESYQYTSSVNVDENIISKLLAVLNTQCIRNSKNEKLKRFIINIINKLNKEKLPKGNISLTVTSKYLKDINDIELLMYLFNVSQDKEVFMIISSLSFSYENVYRIKKYFSEISIESAMTVISAIMSFSHDEYKPSAFLAEVFKFDFSDVLYFLARYKEKDDSNLLNKVRNSIMYFNSVIEREGSILSNEKQKIMCGLKMKYCFRTNSTLTFPKSVYYIDFSFSYIKSKTKHTLLSFNSISDNIDHLSFYIDNDNTLCIDTKSKTLKIEKILPNKTYHINFRFVKRYMSFLSSNEIYIKINDVDKQYNTSDYLYDTYFMTIGPFNGVISAIVVFDDDAVVIKVDPQFMNETYKIERYCKEYNVLSGSTSMKICKVDNSEDNMMYDIPFVLRMTKKELDEGNGFDYFNLIICIMKDFVDRNKSNEYIDMIHEILFDMFNVVFKFDLTNQYRCKKLSVLLFSFSNLIMSTAEYKPISTKLIKLFLGNISIIDNEHAINKILMILLNPSSIDPSLIKKIDEEDNDGIMSSIVNVFIGKISMISLLSSDCVDYYINVFVNYYILSKRTEFIKHILDVLLKKAKVSTIENFIINVIGNVKDNRLCYKLMKALYKSLHNKYDILYKSEHHILILKKLFDILLNSNEDEKYTNMLKAIVVRFIDEYYIKKYMKNIKITYIANNTDDNEYYTGKLCLDKILSLISPSSSNELLRSVLLIAFNTTDHEHNLSFIKSNSLTSIDFESVVTSNDIIVNVFDVIKTIYTNETLSKTYFDFLSRFTYDIIAKIAINSSSSINIFKSMKIFGEIYHTIITISSTTAISLFKIDDVIDIMRSSIYIHNDPFYFKLLFTLISDNVSSSADVLYDYINSMMLSMIELLRYDNGDKAEKLFDLRFMLNNKNIIELFYRSAMMFSSNDSIDKRNKLIQRVFVLFFAYLKTQLKNPLMYARTSFNGKSIIEYIIDVFVEYFMKFPINDESYIDIVNEIFFPSFINKKKSMKIKHNIFFYIDKAKKKSIILNTAMRIEKEFAKANEGTVNTYLLSLVFLKKIVDIKNYYSIDIINETVNDDTPKSKFISLLTNVQNAILNDVNSNFSKMTKISIENNDKKYNTFKSKVINEKFHNGKSITISFINEISTEINNNKSTSLIKERSSVVSNSSAKDIKETTTKDIIEVLNESNDSSLDSQRSFFEIINDIDLWYDDISEEGVMSVLKYKNYYHKKIFALLNKADLYRDDTFKEVIQKEFDKYNMITKDDVLRKKIRCYIPYPIKLKNYITKGFVRPFFKLNRTFYKDSTFKVSHSYLSDITPIANTNIIPKVQFDKSVKYECELIINEGSVYCTLYITKHFIVIKNNDEYNFDPKTKNLFSSYDYIPYKKCIILPIRDINEILVRQFLHYWQACEIFMNNGKSYFVNLFQNAYLNSFFAKIKEGHESITLITDSKEHFTSSNLITKWRTKSISTFTFLNMLNKYSGRTYRDLNQYPIFPWLFAQYDNVDNMKNKNKYRNFQYPISLQSEKKREQLVKFIKESKEDFSSEDSTYNNIPHLSIHYSISAFVYFYLVRLSPITECHIHFQSGAFDNPARMFNNINSTKHILEKFKDNRELIPEFYYMNEMFYNVNLCSLGRQHGFNISDVVLPVNCVNGAHLVNIHRKALETKEVAMTINKWIDNIFGCYNKYFGRKENGYLFNLYQWQTYEDAVKEKFAQLLVNESGKKDVIDDITFILSFGQAPSQIATNPIPIRKGSEDSNDESNSIFDDKNIKEKIDKSIDPKSSYNYVKKYNLNLNSSSEVLKVVKYINKYIVVITSENIMYLYSKKDFTQLSNVFLGANFTFITTHCIIEYVDNDTFSRKESMSTLEETSRVNSSPSKEKNKKVKLPIVIIANYTDCSLTVFPFETSLNPSSLKTTKVISCLTDIKNKSIWTGTSDGYLIRFSISTTNNLASITYNINETSPMNKVHKSTVLKVHFISHLNVVVSIGNDNIISIINASMFEVINFISLCDSPSTKDFFITKYDNILVFDNKKDYVTSFSINGMHFDNIGKGANSERCFDIDNDKYFYVDSERKLIISVEEYNVSKEKWKCELGFIGKNERIKKVRKNTEEKSIDMYMGENEVWRINLKKENGIKRKKKKEEEEEIKKKQKEEEEKKGGVLTYIAKALALNSFTDY